MLDIYNHRMTLHIEIIQEHTYSLTIDLLSIENFYLFVPHPVSKMCLNDVKNIEELATSKTERCNLGCLYLEI